MPTHTFSVVLVIVGQVRSHKDAIDYVYVVESQIFHD